MLNIVKLYSPWRRRVFQVALTGALLLVMVSLAAAASFPAIVPVPNGESPRQRRLARRHHARARGTGLSHGHGPVAAPRALVRLDVEPRSIA